MDKYRQLDISGDTGLEITGESIEDLFKNAAAGLCELITDTSSVIVSDERKVTFSSDSTEDLLVKWLNELIFLFDAQGFIFKDCEIEIENNRLSGSISGGIFNPESHERRLLIKAATYNGLSLLNEGGSWKAKVIFDI